LIHYNHTQTSLKARLMFIPMAAIVSFIALSYGAADPIPMVVILAIVQALLALAIVIFSTLGVAVQGGTLTVSFLYGIMRRTIPLADIVRAERTRLAWYYGAGVKWGGRSIWPGRAPGTMTYLAWPGDAVALTLRNGQRVQIGTDDAEGLLRALAPAVALNPSSAAASAAPAAP
jgi:hypothetical protein